MKKWRVCVCVLNIQLEFQWKIISFHFSLPINIFLTHIPSIFSLGTIGILTTITTQRIFEIIQYATIVTEPNMNECSFCYNNNNNNNRTNEQEKY